MRLVSGHLKRMESVVQPSRYEWGTCGMVMVKSVDDQELDIDWVTLIMNARSLGFSKEDVRKVLLTLKESGNNEMQEAAV